MKRTILFLTLGWLGLVASLRAEQSGGLDWSAWQRMPVLQDGRIMPLDSFARVQVKKICGTVHPNLGKLGSKTNSELRSLSPEDIKLLADKGRARSFLAAELVYGWMVETKSWDDVPFLIADDETLRSDVLDVPLTAEDGSRLRYVSPRQVRLARKKFIAFLTEIERVVEDAQKKKQSPRLSPMQAKLKEPLKKLDDALGLYLQLSYDPGREGKSNPWQETEFPLGKANPWLESDFVGMQGSWERFAQALSQHPPLTVQADNLRSVEGDPQSRQLLKEKLQPCLRAEKLERELYQLADNTNQAMQGFVRQWTSVINGEKPVRSIEPTAANLRQLTSRLDATMRELADSELPDAAILSEDNTETIRAYRQVFSRWTKSFALQTAQLPWAPYSDGGEAIFIVPALEPSALEADRYRSEIRPWISLHALLQGSPGLLHGYATEDVARIRTAWNDAREAYLDRGDSQRASRFSDAMRRFTTDIRGLSENIEPDRQQLPIVERERGILAKTSYPSPIVTDAEVAYNRIDPFFWSGCTSLAAACILGLSFVVLRKPAFWAGSATLVVGVVLIAGGFVLRMFITRWAPVTSMFETIVWVAMCISILTIWVTFLPLLGPSSKKAWQWTAIPGSWEDMRRQDETLAGPSQGSQAGIRAVALALRLGLLLAGIYGGLCYMGVVQSSSEGTGYHVASILPQPELGASMPNLSVILVWAASMFVAVTFIWYLPRIIPAALFAIPMSLALAGRPEASDRMEKIYRWRVVACIGAVASFLAALAANFAPFPKDIEALMPVLRSNFWLGIHVLTITTSYAGAAVAWMIGNAALIYFAFDHYRTVDGQRRPPAICGTLSSLNYRVLQVTVLLLAAGTILGGLWADVSWGRFWGWDPKEVGALVALLIIMMALHGRRAGWHGDLSLAIGAVAGFSGVIWAWYGVNFLLNSGKHSYGAGDGGQWIWLLAIAAAQLLLIGVAVARVRFETAVRPAMNS
jgi:ABC-type transport system involved in cytochrome c biogenesis permease subunit